MRGGRGRVETTETRIKVKTQAGKYIVRGSEDSGYL